MQYFQSIRCKQIGQRWKKVGSNFPFIVKMRFRDRKISRGHTGIILNFENLKNLENWPFLQKVMENLE